MTSSSRCIGCSFIVHFLKNSCNYNVDLLTDYYDIPNFILKEHEIIMKDCYHSEYHQKFVENDPCSYQVNPFFNILSVFIVSGASPLEFYELLKHNTKYVFSVISVHVWKMPKDVPEVVPKHGVVRFIKVNKKLKYVDILSFAVKERCENLINALLALNYPLDRGTIKEKAFSKNPCRQRILEIRRKQKTQQECTTDLGSLFENIEISHDSVGSITTLLDDTTIS